MDVKSPPTEVVGICVEYIDGVGLCGGKVCLDAVSGLSRCDRGHVNLRFQPYVDSPKLENTKVESFVVESLISYFVNSDPVNSDPVNSDPVNSDPVNSDPVNSDPVNPDPVNPDPVNPDPVNPDPVNPDPVGNVRCKDDLQEQVHNPVRYNAGDIECIDALQSMSCGWTDVYAFSMVFQVVKYLWRAPLKRGKEDVEKSIWYIFRLMKYWDKDWDPVKFSERWVGKYNERRPS